MALTCNIDSKGKAVRLAAGIAFLAAAVALTLGWALPSGGALAWAVCGSSFFAGAFSVFEARKGWCALRALGIKTPL